MHSWHNSGWVIDCLDIGLVAFVLYRLMLFVKSVVSVRFFLVCAVVLSLPILSSFLGLRTMSWLSGNVLGSAALILVVVFQHDIRRALVAVRRNRIESDTGLEEVPEVIEELVAATEALALKKIGALIVLERDMSLGNFIAVGTEIDAKVTSELITSIFLPYSPIHDGAVIIQKGKLTKAGCFLPLTQNPAVSKAFGTRHRAAIGLSEVVDAVVIVVSEETGKVSVVVDGRLNLDLDAVALKKVLKKLLEPRWLS